MSASELSYEGKGEEDCKRYFDTWLFSTVSDLAIGAPYGGEDGNGVVYIYHGSQNGIITDIQQVGE